MDLTFTAAEETFRADLRDYLHKTLPIPWREPGFWLRVPDEEGFQMRRGWEREKALAGFAGVHWPVEYGGRGGTPGMKAIYDEEMVRHRAPATVNPLGMAFLAPTVMTLGTDEQKRDIIGPLLRAETIWCQGFSEPDAGSDLAALRTRAELAGDEFIVNGQKIWTTHAKHGDRIFTLARTSSEGRKHAGISLLLIDMRQTGVEVRPLRQMSGATEFGEVFFTDARCPVTDVLGGIGNGWATAMLLLSFERGASAIGQYTEFRDNWDQIVEVARERGRTNDPGVRQRLARDLVELECLKYLSWRVLSDVEQGRDLGFGSSLTKLQWSETYQDLFETFDHVLGSDVGADDPRLHHLQQAAMWTRSVTIWGGSSQVQRNVVAERVLGLPR